MLTFIDNYPMSQITTLQIGGPAKKYVVVRTQDELIEAIKYAKEKTIDYLVIGGGSNLLVSDKDVNSLIIKNEINAPVLHIGSGTLKVQSGIILQDLVDYSISHGLSGLHTLTGIPGTVGGAIYGNAGAYGQTISDHIVSVVILNQFQDLQTLSKDKCGFDYRDSRFKKTRDIILEITFQLEKANPEILQKEADEILAQRLIKYPKGLKCPGSFFKNIVAENLPKEILDKIPKGKIMFGKIPAGYLLEEVGAKGKKLGNIEIANYHGNLFINKGKGTAADFYNLAKEYSEKVRDKFGITLEPEVQLINLTPLHN